PLEDREDHGAAVEHLRAGRALEVARLRGREVAVDEHEARPLAAGARLSRALAPCGARALRPALLDLVGIGRGLRAVVGVLRRAPAAARPGRAAGDHPAAAGPARELAQLPRADAGPRSEPRAALRHAAHDLETERLCEPRELVERRGEVRVRRVGELDP